MSFLTKDELVLVMKDLYSLDAVQRQDYPDSTLEDTPPPEQYEDIELPTGVTVRAMETAVHLLQARASRRLIGGDKVMYNKGITRGRTIKFLSPECLRVRREGEGRAHASETCCVTDNTTVMPAGQTTILQSNPPNNEITAYYNLSAERHDPTKEEHQHSQQATSADKPTGNAEKIAHDKPVEGLDLPKDTTITTPMDVEVSLEKTMSSKQATSTSHGRVNPSRKCRIHGPPCRSVYVVVGTCPVVVFVGERQTRNQRALALIPGCLPSSLGQTFVAKVKNWDGLSV